MRRACPLSAATNHVPVGPTDRVLMEVDSLAGGFTQPEILSPPPSSVASTSISGVLPHPRGLPLRPGGPKESALIRYVDQSILHIQRRYAKRGETGDRRADQIRPGAVGQDYKDEHVEGYNSFADAAKDISMLIDVVWITGTPSVQVPYLLHLALLVNDYIADLPPSPKATFRLLDKLDIAFASLTQGRNVDTGEGLPGFGIRRVSGTEKVRMKSIVDRTRICVVEVFSRGGIDDDEPGADQTETEEDDPDDFNMSEDTEDDGPMPHEVRAAQGDWEMQIARVYDRTVIELGDVLGATPIGIISDD